MVRIILRQYYSELGEEKKFEDTARYNPFVKKWAVRTKKQLTGRGISFLK